MTVPEQAAEQATETRAERIARRFHETYEELAPAHGYTTRKESAVPWGQVPGDNRRLMVATVLALMPELVAFGRDAAAQDIEQHADELAPRDGNIQQRRLRRHLLIAARVAAGKPTVEEVAEALAAGNFVGCHLDEAGRAVQP